jgi:hypothetical protein
LAKLHLPRLTSNSSGALISSRWTDGRGDDVARRLEVLVVLVELAVDGCQGAHDVLRHRRASPQ